MVKLRKTSNQTGKNRAECQKLRGFDFRHCVKPQNPAVFMDEPLFSQDDRDILINGWWMYASNKSN